MRQLAIALLWAAPAVAQPFVVQGQLRLQGSNTIGAELAPALVAEYGRLAGLTTLQIEPSQDPDAKTLVMSAPNGRTLRGEVVAHGSGTAFPALRESRADIGMASRAVTEAERTALRDAGVGDPATEGNTTVLSLDGVVVLVHPANPASALSVEQVRGLFSGAIHNWSELGGENRPVTLYVRDDKSGTTDTFRTLAMSGAAFAAGARAFESSERLSDAVAADAGGVGFAGFAYTRRAKPISLRVSCGLQFAPSPFLVRTEEYPLARRLLLYSPTVKPPLTANFLRWAQSDAAQPIVDQAGFVSLTPELGSPDDRTARLAHLGFGVAAPDRVAADAVAREFTAVTEGARRLSTTFRFEFDQARLDARAVADLGRVAAWYKQGRRQIVLVGHSSNQGEFGYNVALSRRRATDIALRLRALGVDVATIAGVGTVSPVACDDDATRGGLNRRVEIWAR